MTAALSLFMAVLCLVRREREAARFWTSGPVHARSQYLSTSYYRSASFRRHIFINFQRRQDQPDGRNGAAFMSAGSLLFLAQTSDRTKGGRLAKSDNPGVCPRCRSSFCHGLRRLAEGSEVERGLAAHYPAELPYGRFQPGRIHKTLGKARRVFRRQRPRAGFEDRVPLIAACWAARPSKNLLSIFFRVVTSKQ